MTDSWRPLAFGFDPQNLPDAPEEPELCDFCEENEATHFSMDWDASLCDECEEAQKRELERMKFTRLNDLFPGLEG